MIEIVKVCVYLIPAWFPTVFLSFLLCALLVLFGYWMGRKTVNQMTFDTLKRTQNPGPAEIPESGDIFKDAMELEDENERISTI
jgi:hypothetical protein